MPYDEQRGCKMNKWLNGVMGVAIGDALGSPVQFYRRGEKVVSGMEPCTHYHTPAGTWTDDTSLTLATVESIKRLGRVDLKDIAEGFTSWLFGGKFTPFGTAFDIGKTCRESISAYGWSRDLTTCGSKTEYSNGNGSLMRILPVCLVADDPKVVEDASAITHAHRRSQVGCGLYYFLVKEILENKGDLVKRLSDGIQKGFKHYAGEQELEHYKRLISPDFGRLPEEEIKSTGYVVDTLEAAVWSLLNTDSFRGALLKAVNLGDDADSVGAVCGGLAGLYYTLEGMPEEWVNAIQKRDWIEEMCSGISLKA